MAQLDGHQRNDKKRNGGNFVRQGKHGEGNGKRGGPQGRRVHVNKHAHAPRGPKPAGKRRGVPGNRQVDTSPGFPL